MVVVLPRASVLERKKFSLLTNCVPVVLLVEKKVRGRYGPSMSQRE